MTPPSTEELAKGVRAGDRTALGRAITLVESTKAQHRGQAQDLLRELLPDTGGAKRIGITGVPGVGKSTFIEAFGTMLTGQGHKVAVLAVDPTSSRTGGSILGDKTRMQALARDDNAFIRPSPSALTLGGVTKTTRETMALVEAAGYDVVLVETVGVGQSETVVADMVDFFLVLMLPGAGDELQGIKKGVLEVADMIAVNKADGDAETAAELAAKQYRTALHIMTPASPNWTPPVLLCSALKKQGLEEIWTQISLHSVKLSDSGELQDKRRAQQVRWMWSMVEDRLWTALKSDQDVAGRVAELERAVAAGDETPTTAADTILDVFFKHHR